MFPSSPLVVAAVGTLVLGLASLWWLLRLDNAHIPVRPREFSWAPPLALLLLILPDPVRSPAIVLGWGFFVISGFLVFRGMAARRIAIRRLRRWVATFPTDVIVAESPLPADFEPTDGVTHAVASLAELGFARRALVRPGGGDDETTVMIAPDGTWADIGWYGFNRSRPIVWVQITTSLADGRGILTTTNVGFPMQIWDAKLRQVFPGATPAYLLEEHRATLAFLIERGTEVARVEPAELLEVRATCFLEERRAAVVAPYGRLRAEVDREGRADDGPVGPLRSRDDLDERLDAFRLATSGQVPVPPASV